ncbi:hypothetical protein [Psychroserpens sp.]
MKKYRLINYLKFGFLLFGITLLLTTCEKENFAEEKTLDTLTEELSISIKSISISEAGETFNTLKDKYNLDSHFGLQQTGNIQYRTEGESENVGIIIYTNKIKEITKEDYISYTMLIKSLDLDPDTFYNITIEYKEGVEGMFVTQYKKNSESSISKISTKRINDLQETIGKEDFGNEDEETIGGGSGSGGNSIYPTDCDGTVVPTTIALEVPCGCGHSVLQWLIGLCSGSTCGDPYLPYYEYVTTYECVSSGVSTPPDNTDPTTGNPDTSGPGDGNTNGGDGDDSNNTSLTSPVDQEEGATAPEEDPCTNLEEKILLDNANIRPKLELLKSTLMEQGENGFQFKKDNGVYSNPDLPPTTSNSINFRVGGTNYGGAHSHTINLHPMFSWSDVYNLFSFYQHATTDVKNEVTFMVVTQPNLASENPNVYAISITNWIQFRANINVDLNNIVNDNDGLTLTSTFEEKIIALNRDLGELYDKDNDNEKIFLEQFGNHGIKLFKANSDITNWSELELNESLGTVFEVPCI